MKVQGGFLPLLDGLASQALPFLNGTVLPALGVGALSGLASTGVQKLVGDGLYIKKGGCVTNGGVKSAQTPPCDILFFSVFFR